MHTEQSTPTAIQPPEPFSVTSAAAARINRLKREENKPFTFRIGVKGGGCSGFQYEFTLDDQPAASVDIVIEKDGAHIVIDDISLGLLRGSQLDYTEDLSHAGFEIRNPNATARCGCGNSFSVNL